MNATFVNHAADVPATTTADVNPRGRVALRWPAVLSAALVCAGAVPLYVLLDKPVGYAMMAAGLLLAVPVDRRLASHLGLIVLSLVIISTMSLQADISNGGIARFTVVLSAAVLIPYVGHRFLLKQDVIRFPWRTGRRWGRFAWGYLTGVLSLGYLLLPVYFLGSGAYQNWPTVTEPGDIARLFAGVNAVGLWDELFFICTVFALLRTHFPNWLANLLQTTVFVAFLWELGYRSWGPALTIPFALLQGYIFMRTKSLAYVVTVHLSFDFVIFLILVHAHNPQLFSVFLTVPR